MSDEYITAEPDEEVSENEASEKDYTLAKKYLAAVLSREDSFKEGWWKRAEKSEELYTQPCKKPPAGDQNIYNILYSNTEVLLPSLYSATAKPDVRARFKDVKLKPIPEVLERFLVLFTDSSTPGSESFDASVGRATLGALVSATGFLWLRKYDEMEFPLQIESLGFDELIWGSGRKWSRVPWVARKHVLTRAEFEKQFKKSEEEIAENLRKLDDSDSNSSDELVVYEYWHKASRKVYFISEDWREVLVEVFPDPLKLRGFFPTPGPLLLTAKPNSLEPIPLYWYYQEQAEELNRVSARLKRVLSAIRVRGAYSSLLTDSMERILSDGEVENELIPAGESLALAQGGGFEKQIWLLPIEKLVQVAEQLYKAREAIKQVIYELTGISDIIRGSNMASETATATNTKDKWGTIRLRKMQTVVAAYVRDVFRIAVDAGTQVIPAETWKRLVQLPIPLQQEKLIAQQQLAHSQQVAQQNAQMAQMVGQPIPQPQPPAPELVQAAQSPSMEEILSRISSDVDRTFTINIQTASTVDLDTAQDKAEVTEFMNAIGQMFAGLQPLTIFGPSGVEAIKALAIGVCQRYKFGLGAVDALEKLQLPPPPQAAPEPPKGPPPEVIKAEADARIAEIQAKMALLEKETALKEREFALKEKEFALRERELMRKEQIAQAQAQRDLLTASTPPATVSPTKSRRNASVRP